MISGPEPTNAAYPLQEVDELLVVNSVLGFSDQPPLKQRRVLGVRGLDPALKYWATILSSPPGTTRSWLHLLLWLPSRESPAYEMRFLRDLYAASDLSVC